MSKAKWSANVIVKERKKTKAMVASEFKKRYLKTTQQAIKNNINTLMRKILIKVKDLGQSAVDMASPAIKHLRAESTSYPEMSNTGTPFAETSWDQDDNPSSRETHYSMETRLSSKEPLFGTADLLEHDCCSERLDVGENDESYTANRCWNKEFGEKEAHKSIPPQDQNGKTI